MLTKKVTDDDRFMELSASAQALYLHLSMSADDDGFCNQVAISMFKAHASIQDLQALLEKRYIYQFENGVIVIKHWRNWILVKTENILGCQMVANRLPIGCHRIG